MSVNGLEGHLGKGRLQPFKATCFASNLSL